MNPMLCGLQALIPAPQSRCVVNDVANTIGHDQPFSPAEHINSRMHDVKLEALFLADFPSPLHIDGCHLSGVKISKRILQSTTTKCAVFNIQEPLIDCLVS